MKITIKHDFPQVARALTRMRQDIAQKATVRAVNRTADLAKTAMSREIRGEFNLTAAKVREKLFLRKAGFRAGQFGIEAVLYSQAKRRSINLINFAARETKKGLTAKIKRKGGRVLVSGKGFIANQGRTAFARVGKKRLPIKALQTIDVPQMFNTRRINTKVVDLIKRRFPEVFEREARFYLNKLGGK